MKLSDAQVQLQFAAYNLFITSQETLTPHGDIALEITVDASRATQIIRATSFDEQASEDIDPFLGLRNHQVHNLAALLNLPREYWRDFTRIATELYRCYVGSDAITASCTLLFPPAQQDLLLITCASLDIDENALGRQPQFIPVTEQTPQIRIGQDAAEQNFDYVCVNYLGRVGCIVNGAGLGMATLDAISYQQLQPAFFMDVHESYETAAFSAALTLALRHPALEAIIINLYNTHLPGEHLAHALLHAYRMTAPALPIIVRIGGFQAKKALQHMNDARSFALLTTFSLREAVHRLHTLLAEEGVIYGDPDV